MIEKQILLNNLFKKLKVEELNIKNIILQGIDEIMLVSRNKKYKISLIIKLEKD